VEEKMPITGAGWELLVQRLGLHKSGMKTRTYGTYQAYRDGQPIAGLNGNVCESPGPSEYEFEATKFDPRRIRSGPYPKATGARTGIIIHPGHPPTLYISSIGCLNLTKPLQATEKMDFEESRPRIIAVIDSLYGFAPTAFHKGDERPIPNAAIIIEGDPKNVLPGSVDPDAVA
jgi:hypothetical protein